MRIACPSQNPLSNVETSGVVCLSPPIFFSTGIDASIVSSTVRICLFSLTEDWTNILKLTDARKMVCSIYIDDDYHSANCIIIPETGISIEKLTMLRVCPFAKLEKVHFNGWNSTRFMP